MPQKNYCLLLLCLSFSFTGFAQQQLFGRIKRTGSTEVLPGVSVTNSTRQNHNVSDMGGNYIISAKEGDIIVFSSAGYRPDTIVVALYMFDETYPVALIPNIVTLPGVEVDETAKYQADSMKRREDYEFVLNRKHPVKLMNEKRPGDAPGLNFSPIGYFSSGQEKERKFKKQLEKQEEEYYIDFKFPPSRVAMLTRLTGDSLHTFMLQYRPTYKFCRGAASKDMLLYINDKLKLFRKS